MALDTVYFPPVHRQPLYAYNCVFHAASTDTYALLKELRRFLAIENYNSLTLQLSTPAYEKARTYIEKAGQRYILPTPEFTPDGEGGIDIEWEYQGRHLALNFSAQGDGDFVSWREPNGRYEGEPATESRFIQKLDWLLS